MGEFFRSFGVEWHVLLAQLANFAILLFVLERFAYRPLLRVLRERQDRLKTDEARSKALSEELAKAEQKRNEVLAEVRAESEKIIKQAEAAGKELADRIIVDGQNESEKIVAAGRKTLSEERSHLSAEVKQGVGELIALAVGKVVGGAVDKQSEGKLVEEAVQIIKEAKQGHL